MLILPVITKTDQKKIPYACLALILLNSIIFFFFQAGDSEILEQAYGYYHNSGLNDVELEAYTDYLRTGGELVDEDILEDPQGRTLLTGRMFTDDTFNNLLLHNRIIHPGNPAFNQWREKRDHFEKIRQHSVLYSFGYSPQRKNYTGLLTCMFLHGGVMHLVGNMVFLWLVGAILEQAVGCVRFLVLYIFTGICASALFGLIYPLSPGPLVGASGAIAGLMGSYGVIFGYRKIRVFYSLGFYFNYATIPAISLFPLWLGKEFLQLYTNQGSNVAYMAHIGGLISGILVGMGYKIADRQKIDALFEHKEEADNLEKLLESGMKKLTDLDLVNARKDFNQVLALEPDNKIAIRQLFEIDKTLPQSNHFHKSANRFLHSLKKSSAKDYLEIFEEYRRLVEKPRITNEILAQVAHCYLCRQNYQKATPYISAMLKRTPDNSKLPGFILTLAHGYHKTNKTPEADKCYRLLVARYGGTREAVEAVEYLKRL